MIKVVWICHFSNEAVHVKLKYSSFYFRKILALLTHSQIRLWNDFAVWNTNAIKQFEQYDDIDLTVIFPYAGIVPKIQKFDINGVHYIAFRSEDDYLYPFLKKNILKYVYKRYEENRKRIKSLIDELKPDIVHVIGAENPYYSIASLDIPNNIPSIVSLQTLMSRPDFAANYPVRKNNYEFRSGLEKQIIKKCSYIGSQVDSTRLFVWENIKKDAIFLNLTLAVGVDIDYNPCNKEYDFVYFAANISKACDYAIEAFALANKKRPGLTLNVSGSYQAAYKARLDARLQELGIQNQVIFTGARASHNDVLIQIKKSRFALLPLKVDLISGTIREAMACGLPVVTTITPATPKLNEERESVLLSEKGDYQTMADNMIRLVDDESFALQIRNNAIKTMQEKYSNDSFMQKWRKAYHEIVDNIKKGKPFTEDIVSK